MKFKKLTSIILVFVLAISIVACSNDNGEKLNNENKIVVEGNEDKDKDKESTVSQGNQNQDKQLTDELLKEKEVSNGQVYFQDDWVIGTMIIKEGVSEEKAKEIAQQYAEKLKAKHKDKKINVQAVNKSGSIANIEL